MLGSRSGLLKQYCSMSFSPPALKRRRLGNNERQPITVTVKHPDINHLQVYSWNINGIQPFIQRPITSFFRPKSSTSKGPKGDAPTTASLRDFLRRHDWPTILCLQEVKIKPDDKATKSAVQKAVKSTVAGEPDYEAHFCLPTDPHNARGFVVRNVSWDLEGRIQITETENPSFSIWNIYAVNGTDNAYKSQTGAVEGTRHDRKLAVHKHILDEAKLLEEQGYHVILAGDMNIARSRIDGHPNLRTYPQQHVINRADFNKKFFDTDNGLKAIDTYRHIHGDEKGYTSLGRNIVDAGICATEKERGPSDHVPLFASFNLAQNPSGGPEELTRRDDMT
ncbi:DNase I-like protein [Aureobasidium subglaciale]|nr:DNase I-like protein [Aureobasidium subglaciale]KAI5227662.1 DNase I-like protein [Aureobasidium subglaciale]KAI5231055.1 DNase I-like protein [Aureobasidium subglaciale]KAI5265190.1 DNase I-like protein [Aureobasidium subglaciale]